jgi:hypothetical protein
MLSDLFLLPKTVPEKGLIASWMRVERRYLPLRISNIFSLGVKNYMRRYRLPLIAAILMLSGFTVYFAAPMLSPASSRVATHLNADTWKNAGSRLQPHLVRAGFSKLPEKITFIALKDRKELEVWGTVGKDSTSWRFIRSYPILAASGTSGPKLREGDRQVPEGVYNITLLNPKSSYYLSMKIDYPNALDRAKAQQDGRTNLGGDICIHGWELSAGCLAVGNVAIEELYLLTSKVGMQNTRVIIAPNDLRHERPLLQGGPAVTWLNELYSTLAREMEAYPRDRKVASN